MSSICLSLAPNLRCEKLTFPESIGLLVPPSLELIFCLSLIVIKHGTRVRKEYFLASEGFMYFLLVLLDTLSHQIVNIRNSLPTFKALDIVIGILSTLPLALYMIYLYVLTTKDFLPSMPTRFQAVGKYALLLLIPMVLLFNLLGSFVTLTYRIVQFYPGGFRIGVKFTDKGLEMFFSSLTLVLFIVFQALNFCACFYRLVQAAIDQRRIDLTAHGNDNERHLFNGIGWIALGIKLGAIETIVGFASGDFGLVLTRRILRFMGRACLIIGIVKGLDTVEDFNFIKSYSRPRPRTTPRRSALLALISEPKTETFHQIGGYDYEATTQPPAAVIRSRTISAASSAFPVPSPARSEHGITTSVRSERYTTSPVLSGQFVASPSEYAFAASPNSAGLATPYSARLENVEPPVLQPPAPTLSLDTRSISPNYGDQRVIVRYRHGRAPTLDLRRFSDLGITPSDEKKNPFTDAASADAIGEGHSPELKSRALPSDEGYAESLYTSPATASSYSFSLATSNITYPRARYTIGGSGDLPRRKKSASKGETVRKSTQTYVSRADTMDLIQALSTEFPGVPRRSNSGIAPSIADTDTDTIASPQDLTRSVSGRTTNSRTGLVRRSSSTKRKPVPAYDDELFGPQPGASSPADGPVPQAGVPPLPQTRKLPSSPRPRARRQTAQSEQSKPASVKSPQGSALEFPWVQPGGDVVEDGKAELEDAWSKSGGARIKSIGSVARSRTPAPSSSEFSRDSVVASWHDGPSDRSGYPTPPLSAVGMGGGA